MTWSFLPALVVAWAGRHQLPSTFQPLWICFQFWWSYFTFVTMVWRQMQCCRRPHFSSWECAFFLRRYFFGWCIFWFGFRPSWVVTRKSPSRLDLHLLKQWFPFSTWSCRCYVSKFVRCWFQLIGSSFKKADLNPKRLFPEIPTLYFQQLFLQWWNRNARCGFTFSWWALVASYTFWFFVRFLFFLVVFPCVSGWGLQESNKQGQQGKHFCMPAKGDCLSDDVL